MNVLVGCCCSYLDLVKMSIDSARKAVQVLFLRRQGLLVTSLVQGLLKWVRTMPGDISRDGCQNVAHPHCQEQSIITFGTMACKYLWCPVTAWILPCSFSGQHYNLLGCIAEAFTSSSLPPSFFNAVFKMLSHIDWCRSICQSGPSRHYRKLVCSFPFHSNHTNYSGSSFEGPWNI